MVHLDGVRAGAELASALEQPCDQLLVGVERPVRLTVDQDRRLLPLERIPPNRATSGFLLSRTMLASKHVRGPYGVTILA